MIHERIRRARLLRGMSLEQLAQAIGDISKQALSKFEQGTAMPNSTRLLQLAAALQVLPEYFFRPDSVALAPLAFRQRAKMPRYRQEQIEEQMREHLERYIALERCFDAADILMAPPAAGSLAVASLADAEHAAQRLRQQWAAGNGAIANLTALLEEHGIKVALLEGPPDFDGAGAASDDHQHVLIALNRTQPGEQMRFTAAHELGHWLMALPDTMTEHDKQACCQRFAGALLYPAAQLLLDFGNQRRTRIHPAELLNAKRRYGISMQLALTRLKDLDLLSDAGYKTATALFTRHGWRNAEPEPLPAEQARRFESLVFWGLAEALFSPSRAAEFLQRPLEALAPGLLRVVEPA